MSNPSQRSEQPRQAKLKLEIVKKGDAFAVQDEGGVEYGPQAKTRKQAEEILKDWKAYYSE
jgi:hypothetical protein